MKSFSLVLLLLSLIFFPIKVFAEPEIYFVAVPDGGIQPQVAVDSRGTVHLIYFKGDPLHGDLYYVTKAPRANGKFSNPIRINSIEQSVVCKGTIRGGQLALGKNDSVCVTWNSSEKAPDYKHYVGFSKYDSSKNSFAPQRMLGLKDIEMDGGDTIAADASGNIFMFWHASKVNEEEAQGRIYMTKSTDFGKNFSAPQAIDLPTRGACGCCSMKDMTNNRGSIYVLYLAADKNTARDTVLLSSKGYGKIFHSQILKSWELDACPMTMFALSSVSNAVYAGWESGGNSNFAVLGSSLPTPITSKASAKYPTIAVNKNSDILLAWTEGSAWQKGGISHYQIFDSKLKPLCPPKGEHGLKPWSFSSVAAEPSGNFILFY